ncbi:hypothetical protein D3C78_464970 [compost metagenome]
MRNSSRRWQLARLAGSSRRRLPESISFCRAAHCPSASGRPSISLSVRINQRSPAGSDAAGTVAIRLALNPTMVSAGQRPSTSGSSVKRFSEQKIMRSLVNSASSSGSRSRSLPVRSSTSSVSLRLRISGGNTVRFSASLRWRAPQSSPARSCSRVCMGSSQSGWPARGQRRRRALARRPQRRGIIKNDGQRSPVLLPPGRTQAPAA